MEPGQTGTGSRVTTTLPDTTRDVDAFSEQVFAYLDPNQTSIIGGLPGIGASTLPGNPVAIVLDRVWEGPPTGVIDILAGSLDATSYGTWQYNGVIESTTVINGVTRTVSALIGPQSRPNAFPLTPPIATNNSYLILLRREAITGQALNDPTNSIGIPQIDTTYGSAFRPSALRVDDFASRAELDGSMTLSPVRQALQPQQMGMLQPAFWNEALPGPDVQPRRFRAEGLFGSVVYFNESGITPVDTTIYQIRQDGPTFSFNLDNNGELRAAIPITPTLLGVHQFRVVVKFDYEADDLGNNLVHYMGLFFPGPLAGTPANKALASPPDLINNAFMGLRFQGDPVAPGQHEFVVSNALGDSLVIPAGVLNPGDPYYLIIETERDGYVDPDASALTAPSSPYRLNMTLRDRQLEVVSQIVLKGDDPNLPSSIGSSNLALGLFLGNRAITVAGESDLRIYYVSCVTRKDLAGPKA